MINSPTNYTAIAGIILVIVNIIVSIGVFQEAERYRKQTGQKNAFFNPLIWFFVTLSTGVMGAALFWLSHWLAPRKPT